MRLALVALLVPLTAACSTYTTWRFGPTPQEHQILLEGERLPLARAQISCLGIVDDEQDGEPRMRFRLRLENPRAAPLQLSLASFELVDAELTLFPAPSVRVLAPPEDADAERELAQAASILVEVRFAFPRETTPMRLDLSGLRLRWGVSADGEEFTASAGFQKVGPIYVVDPYYPYVFGVYGRADDGW